MENTPEGSFLGLDFETSGYSKWSTSAAVEIGLVEIFPNGELKVLASSLLSGAKWISPAAYRVHKIGLWQCRGKPTLHAFREILEEHSNRPICVHAKGTEKKILREMLGLEHPHWVDSLLLSRRHLTACPNHKLETVTKFLNLEIKLQQMFPRGKWHQAAYDAAASALIVQEIQRKTKNATT